MADHNEIGKQGEALAASYLAKKGYDIVTQNWRFQKAEIDIIAKHENQIVIVEVKTRTSLEFENPKEAVTIPKQKRIVKAADAFIQEQNIDLECRFDIVSVLIQGKKTDIEHIEDAFGPLL
jgi:putative endonuclease